MDKIGASVKPTKPTQRDVLADIYKVAQINPVEAGSLFRQYERLRLDPSTPLYNPYNRPTNGTALKNLSLLTGENVEDGVDDAWIADHEYLSLGERTWANGAIRAPLTRHSTTDQQKGYWFREAQIVQPDTNRAKDEWRRLKDHLTRLALDPWSYSDAEILDGIDWAEYPTLKTILDGEETGEVVPLNQAIDFSKDAMEGVLWAARNGGGSGDSLTDALAYALGEGNGYTANFHALVARDPDSPDYNPSAFGTLNDFKRDQGVEVIDEKWLEDNAWMLDGGLGDPALGAIWQQAAEAVENQRLYDEEWERLKGQVEDMVGQGYSDDDIRRNILAHMDRFKILSKVEEGKKTGEAVPMATGAPYAVSKRIMERNADSKTADGITETDHVQMREAMAQDAADPRIAAENIEQAQRAHKAGLVVGYIADGEMNAVLSGQQAQAAQETRLVLEQAQEQTQALQREASEKVAASSESMDSFFKNPADVAGRDKAIAAIREMKQANAALEEAKSRQQAAQAASDKAQADFAAAKEEALTGLREKADRQMADEMNERRMWAGIEAEAEKGGVIEKGGEATGEAADTVAPQTEAGDEGAGGLMLLRGTRGAEAGQAGDQGQSQQALPVDGMKGAEATVQDGGAQDIGSQATETAKNITTLTNVETAGNDASTMRENQRIREPGNLEVVEQAVEAAVSRGSAPQGLHAVLDASADGMVRYDADTGALRVHPDATLEQVFAGMEQAGLVREGDLEAVRYRLKRGGVGAETVPIYGVVENDPLLQHGMPECIERLQIDFADEIKREQYRESIARRILRLPSEVIPLLNAHTPSDLVKKWLYKWSLNPTRPNGAYFDPKMKKIFLNFLKDCLNPRGQGTTFLHEYGHFLDRIFGYFSHSNDLRKALHDDFWNLVKRYSSPQDAFDDLTRILNDRENGHLYSSISDLLNGLSGGRIYGWYGHGASYWKYRWALNEEAVAHFFEASTDQDRENAMRRFFPIAYEWYLEQIRSLANRR